MKNLRKPTAFVIVDDDDDSRKSLVELCKTEFGKYAAIRDYESLCEASQSGRVEVLLVDTSAMSHGHWSFMASGLAKFISEHPSAEVFIQSGMSSNAIRDLIDDLREDYKIDTTNIHVAGFQWDSIRDAIKNKSNYLPREEWPATV